MIISKIGNTVNDISLFDVCTIRNDFFVFKTGKKQKQTDKIVLLTEMCGKKEKNIRKTRLLILVGNTEISMVYPGIEFSF